MIYRVICLSVFFAFVPRVGTCAVSQVTNGVYLVVEGLRNLTIITNGPIRSDDNLAWLTFCNTGKVELSAPLDPAYGVKITMLDSEGKEVKKTALGQHFGSEWNRLRKITDTHVYPELAWGSYKDNADLGGARIFPKPEELFWINKAGVYTLEIQMQMFRYVDSHDVDKRSKTLFRFSPIKIEVDKLPKQNKATH